MKKNLTSLAAALTLAGLLLAPAKAHSAVVGMNIGRITTIPTLPHFPIPAISTKHEIQLPSPVTKYDVTPAFQLSSVKLLVAVPLNNKVGEQVTVKILPSIPVLFPGKRDNDITIRKFGALFDGADKKKEEVAPAVVVPQADKKIVPEKIEEIITKDRLYTLPESTLEDEIGI